MVSATSSNLLIEGSFDIHEIKIEDEQSFEDDFNVNIAIPFEDHMKVENKVKEESKHDENNLMFIEREVPCRIHYYMNSF